MPTSDHSFGYWWKKKRTRTTKPALPWHGPPTASVPQRCPWPNVGHPWPQSLQKGAHLGWSTLFQEDTSSHTSHRQPLPPRASPRASPRLPLPQGSSCHSRGAHAAVVGTRWGAHTSVRAVWTPLWPAQGTLQPPLPTPATSAPYTSPSCMVTWCIFWVSVIVSLLLVETKRVFCCHLYIIVLICK